MIFAVRELPLYLDVEERSTDVQRAEFNIGCLLLVTIRLYVLIKESVRKHTITEILDKPEEASYTGLKNQR